MTVTNRGCVKDQDDADAKCQATANLLHGSGYSGEVDNCLVCDTDGCNEAVQYGPIALLVVLPAAIAKFLLF